MTPDRYQHVVDLCQAAWEQSPETRGVFVQQACLADDELRREVEAMLAADEQPSQFLDESPDDIAAEALVGRPTRPLIGETLGDYRVIERLGRGGMGEVFLAQDTRLKRRAALKLLPEEYTSDPARLRRFEQEACAVSALNHPNIVTVYGLGQAASVSFLATEFVEGRTLRQELANGPLPAHRAVEIAIQTSLALSAAHGADIIHRDIKPENIMLRPDGLVKVLDFGLAKWTEKRTGVEASLDLTECVTAPGLIVGTPRYMSPEQARGVPVDCRTDLFTLGSVLYEMLSGHPAMEGQTPSDILAAVLTLDPIPLESLCPECPAGLIRITRRALERDRETRYQSAEEMAADLKVVQQQLETGKFVRAGNRFGARHIASLAAACLVLAVVLFLHYSRAPGRAIDSIAVLPFVNEGGSDLAFLADGLTDSLIGDLSDTPNLRVISRSSVFRFKGQQVDPAMTGAMLKAQSVLLGRVSQRGDRLFVRVELVDVRDNHRLWGEQYNPVRGDLPQMQIDISREVLDKLRITLTKDAQRQLSQRHKVDPEAYQLYLKGRSFLLGGTQADLNAAVLYFHRALARDPSYALPSIGVANAYVGLADYISPREAMPRAREYALKAIELGGAPSEAHVALGLVKLLYDWDWRGAEREFKQDSQRNPSTVETFSCYLHYEDALGRTNEAIAGLAELLAGDPMSPWKNEELGCVSYYGRRYDAVIAQFRRTIKLSPDFQIAYAVGGRAFVQKRMYKEAIDVLEKGRQIDPDWPLLVAELGYAHAVSGDKAAARGILRELESIASHRYVDAYGVALVHLGLGDREKTFYYLEKAYADRSSSMPWLKAEPRLDVLRSDPRYVELLERVGLRA